MVSKQALKLAGLTATLTVLAGCGQGTALSSASTDALALRNAGANSHAQPGDRGGKPGKGFRGEKGRKGDQFGPFGMLSGVNLTDEQKTQLKAIAEKYRPAKPADGQKPDAPGAKVRELLLADTVDAAALKAALADRPQPPADAGKNRLAMLVEARAVLTDEQRNALIEKIKALPTPTVPSDRPVRPADANRPDPAARLVASLNLSAEQQAAYDAFNAKLKAARDGFQPPKFDPAAQRDAWVSFLQTGDTAGLEAARPHLTPPAFPVDELVTLATGLTLDQRKQLFSHGFRFGGPRGGHGGHEGPGGREHGRR